MFESGRESKLGDRVAAVLSEQLLLTPSLRRMIAALPDDPRQVPAAQAEAVASLIVMHVWLFSADGALELLRRADEASGGALGLVPRRTSIRLGRAGTSSLAAVRATIGAAAARLGFSPLARCRAMTCGQLVAELLEDEVEHARLDLQVEVAARVVVLEGARSRPWPRERLDAVGQLADQLDLRERGGQAVLRARLCAGPAS